MGMERVRRNTGINGGKGEEEGGDVVTNKKKAKKKDKRLKQKYTHGLTADMHTCTHTYYRKRDRKKKNKIKCFHRLCVLCMLLSFVHTCRPLSHYFSCVECEECVEYVECVVPPL